MLEGVYDHMRCEYRCCDRYEYVSATIQRRTCAYDVPDVITLTICEEEIQPNPNPLPLSNTPHPFVSAILVGKLSTFAYHLPPSSLSGRQSQSLQTQGS